MNERYCMYLRKSRADAEAEMRGEGETLARHQTMLLALAKSMNIQVDYIFKEIVSGETIAARPEMQKLLSEVGDGKWTAVLVVEVERLARGDSVDQGLVSQAFKLSGTKIITPTKTYDPNNEFDEEYFEFGLFMARREYNTIRRRLQRGREASAKEGKFVGSIAPYGYKRKKIENDKGWTLEIVPEQAEIVKMIFEWYVNGTKVNGKFKRLGMQALVKRMNELGFKPHRRDYWQKETLKDIITNPTYCGKIRWGYRKVKKVVSADGKRITRPINYDDSCIVVKGLHEPIVSEEIFNKAQELLAQVPPPPVRYKSEIKNPFAGIIKCSVCGCNMTMRSPFQKKPAYLVCHKRGCATVGTRFVYVEDRVRVILENWIKGYQITSHKESQQEDLLEKLQEGIVQNDKNIEQLRKQLSSAYDLVEKGVYTADEFISRSSEIKTRIEESENQKKKLQDEYDLIYQQEQAKKEFVPKVMSLLEVYDTLDVPKKNEMLKAIIDHMEYKKDKSAHEGAAPDDFLLTVYPKLPQKL